MFFGKLVIQENKKLKKYEANPTSIETICGAADS
jgi:hypothetical protein